MKTITINVNGMHCMKCAAKVENALAEVVGVINAKVSLEHNNVTVDCLDSTDEALLVQSIKDCGFEA